jgi:parallel beta-helix repeat protein
MTWYVGPAVCGATCIQAAVDDSSNGDTVKAKTGVFNEHVIVNKSITLTAGSSPIIDGGGTGTGIAITASNASVSLFEVRNVQNGITSTGANNVSITGNVIKNHHQRGVSIDASANVLVDGNTIDGQAGGTTATPGSSPDTDLRYYGVFVVDSTGTVSNNIIKAITHGPSNGTQSGVGIRVTARAGAGSSNVSIATNNISDVQKNAMVITNAYVGASVNANVTGNTVAGNGPVSYIAQNGIQVSSGATAIVSGNNVSGYDYVPSSVAAVGILLISAGTTSVTSNNVHNNMEGLYIQTTNGVIVNNNAFASTRDTAIFVYLSNNGTYTGNTVLGQPASTGIYVYDVSSNNSVTGNAFRNGDFGVIVDFTGSGAPAANLFNGNCLAGNIGAGVETLGTLVGPKVNARSNWWGAVNGAAPDGSGDSIIPGDGSTIDASLFLTAPVVGCPNPSVFDPDTDGDGCSDGEEVGLNHLLGGDRDPLSPWDFFDVPTGALTVGSPGGTRNKVVNINDVIAIVFYIGTFNNGPANTNGVDYDTDLNSNLSKDGREYDRTPSMTVGKPWRSGPPNGAVSINDAIVALNQIGNNCSP